MGPLHEEVAPSSYEQRGPKLRLAVGAAGCSLPRGPLARILGVVSA
eukprot:CAMPEP_0179212372 /NCGR_PEP_ID=MMETSP0797-20121207/1077_1 /TAXON_ID=47934 /ORGANISM="Dinophysis acuminata, Strain DAEP01" /LENGTH=45 /DNA_ID= /DNA_START= /DNA_END= /DNA_ORIENTATION=